MLRFVYDYIDVTKFGNYMFNFLLRCLFKHSSNFCSIYVTPFKLLTPYVCCLWNSLEQVWCVSVQQVVLWWMCVCVCACWHHVAVSKVELNGWYFKKHAFVSWRFIAIFVIYYANYNTNHHRHHLPPWIRSLDLFRHQGVAIVFWGIHDLFFL